MNGVKEKNRSLSQVAKREKERRPRSDPTNIGMSPEKTREMFYFA